MRRKQRAERASSCSASKRRWELPWNCSRQPSVCLSCLVKFTFIGRAQKRLYIKFVLPMLLFYVILVQWAAKEKASLPALLGHTIRLRQDLTSRASLNNRFWVAEQGLKPRSLPSVLSHSSCIKFSSSEFQCQVEIHTQFSTHWQ